MIYPTADAYRQASHRRVMLFGMSGLGKTHLSNMLRDAPREKGGGWFHYSVDYRIGTHYMGGFIADMFKREAIKNPLLRELLLSDSVYIASNITFDNLAPLSTYLGKPGDPAKGGLPFEEYLKRQEQHREAEIAATLDAARFIERAEEIYGYRDFICDTSGSICEVVEATDAHDSVMEQLSQTLLLVWIKGTEDHREELIRRFDRAPKPIYYQPDFLRGLWAEYLAQESKPEDQVDPDAFLRFGYARLLSHRQPRYEAMARWGVTVTAEEVADVRTPEDFDRLIARAIDRRAI
ncbi:ATPase [Xinfangfangia sp. CPCC 101601]|uniref:ATPase n=1 Tax=Pseudogemmobacter lacusdianii TaxID=3069608 RepID=A0ABU0VUQ6_9RHOB|nr:ATPase [Xinfangfangia sp. CPCC 101601]MDQ2065462.1 ATPase [Xinfangfangia sp. CPCC 101601]